MQQHDAVGAGLPASRHDVCLLTPGQQARVEEEVATRLSRAAHKLELEEWSFLAQYMAAHQVKRERSVNEGWAYDESSACDMAWLSPCS